MRCRHDLLHENAVHNHELSEEERYLIASQADAGLEPFQICSILQRSSPCTFSWSQVYYRWCESTKSKFFRNLDPFLSCKLFLTTSQNLESCYRNDQPFAIGFTTRIGAVITDGHECAEAFIDSTYKTNSSKLELFCVLTTVFGTGFPLAYLFLQSSDQDLDARHSRQSLIHQFLHCLRDKVPRFRPKFFFSDKDHGQINVIRSCFHVEVSLCFWHMKRAVKFKVKDIRKPKEGVISDDLENKIMAILSRHYNMHPLIFPGKDSSMIREQALEEIESLRLQEETKNLYDYLLKNWYSSTRFVTWGRRNDVHGIPFTPTTMIVEAHWSILSRHYLVLHNRPRVDFITHLIDSVLMGKFENDYDLLCRGIKKPLWWKDFFKEWKGLAQRTARNVYFTDTASWTCSCPAFLTSRFLMCEHFISGQALPFYRDVVRKREAPFLLVRRDYNRHFAQLENKGPASNSISSQGQLSNNEWHSPRFGTMSSSLSDPSAANDVEVISKELQSMTTHVHELASSPGSAKQIVFIKNNVFTRLNTYHTNVQKNLSSRGTPITWKTSDTLYLP